MWSRLAVRVWWLLIARNAGMTWSRLATRVHGLLIARNAGMVWSRVATWVWWLLVARRAGMTWSRVATWVHGLLIARNAEMTWSRVATWVHGLLVARLPRLKPWAYGYVNSFAAFYVDESLIQRHFSTMHNQNIRIMFGRLGEPNVAVNPRLQPWEGAPCEPGQQS